MRIKDIHCIIKYVPTIKKWTAYNRRDHILGIHLKGSNAIHDFGDRKISLDENCIYFLNQKDDFSVEIPENESTEAFSVHFTTYEPVLTESFCVNAGNRRDEIIGLLDKIKRQHELSYEDNNLTLSLIYKLFSVFEEIKRKNYTKKDIRIIKAKEYIDLHFREESCLKKAVEISEITKRRFNDVFKNMFGTTPNRYIVKKKVNYAKDILMLDNVNINDVSELSGFSDVYYFCKVFKAETGYTPAKYRKAQKA